jgi:hypothetical protein
LATGADGDIRLRREAAAISRRARDLEEQDHARLAADLKTMTWRLAASTLQEGVESL